MCILYTGSDVCSGVTMTLSRLFHGRTCLTGGVIGDSVHNVAFPRRVVMCFLSWNCVEEV